MSVADQPPYTTQLQAGLGLIPETQTLLDLWTPGMTAPQLYQGALASGLFPTLTARRLRNLVVEGFAPRYLVSGGAPAAYLKLLATRLTTPDLTQLLFLHTCRAHPILGDFVRLIYWPRYATGYPQLTNADAHAFVQRGIDDGRTRQHWAPSTVQRVAAYLTGGCADFGLLEPGPRTSRRLLPFRISPVAAAYLAHELHFAGWGDNALLAHDDWHWFGLAREDVLEELKRLSRQGWFIVQAAGEVVRISWHQPAMEAFCHVLAQG